MRVNSLEPNEYAFEDSTEVKVDWDLENQSITISLLDGTLRPNKLYFTGIAMMSLSYGNIDANRIGEIACLIVETKVNEKVKMWNTTDKGSRYISHNPDLFKKIATEFTKNTIIEKSGIEDNHHE